jgi:1,4-dihydroxy-6-naphthoate synthase
MTTIDTAFSPCPNDTFIFHAMITGLIDTRGFAFSPVIADVEELNRRAFRGGHALTKLSYHAYLLLKERYLALDSGSALGFGCGPLLVARNSAADFSRGVIAIPGEYTTAHLLLKLWRPGLETVSVRFDEIMPGVRDGLYGAGLIIHEGRFVYSSCGLEKIVDLGEWWEGETGFPIPLGCIALRRDLADRISGIDAVMAASVDHALENRDASREFVKGHAREMDDGVIDGHIRLYVNEFTRSLGEAGRGAVDRLEELARARGAL